MKEYRRKLPGMIALSAYYLPIVAEEIMEFILVHHQPALPQQQRKQPLNCPVTIAELIALPQCLLDQLSSLRHRPAEDEGPAARPALEISALLKQSQCFPYSPDTDLIHLTEILD